MFLVVKLMKILAVLEMIGGVVLAIVYGSTLIGGGAVALGYITMVISIPIILSVFYVRFKIYNAADDYYRIQYSYRYGVVNTSIFHGEEGSSKQETSSTIEEDVVSDTVVQNNFENAIKVEVDSHGEAICPKCKKTVTFDPPNCASKCKRCGVLLKPVKKKG